MGFTYQFEDDALYGAADVNGIVANFTSAGVGSYSDLNGIVGALTNAGVENKADSCRATVSGSQIKILPGVAYFSDGSSVTVDENGVLLEKLPYIYMKKDPDTGAGRPVSSETAPSAADVPLAEYRAGGLKDKRSFAKSKIAGYGGNVYERVIHHKHWNSASSDTLVATFDLKHECGMICLFDDAENVGDKRLLAWGKLEENSNLFKYWGVFQPEDAAPAVYYGTDCIYLEKSLTVGNNTFYFKQQGTSVELWYRGGGRDIALQIYFC